MTAGLHNDCEGDRKVAANIGLILAAVYATWQRKAFGGTYGFITFSSDIFDIYKSWTAGFTSRIRLA